MSQETPERPPTLMGVPYWKDHIVGVIDNLSDAEQAVEALHRDGFCGDGARTWTGPTVLSNHQAFMEHRSVWQRIGQRLATEESAFIEEYLDEMRAGHNLVAVYAPTEELAKRVQAILASHRTHSLRHLHGSTFSTL